MTCRHRLEILPTGRVTGTITTGAIVIQEGAFVEGRLQMRPSDHQQRSDGRDAPGPAGVSVKRGR
jgi:cytoskeletal protein CcmA (bactofilin family)